MEAVENRLQPLRHKGLRMRTNCEDLPPGFGRKCGKVALRGFPKREEAQFFWQTADSLPPKPRWGGRFAPKPAPKGGGDFGFSPSCTGCGYQGVENGKPLIFQGFGEEIHRSFPRFPQVFHNFGEKHPQNPARENNGSRVEDLRDEVPLQGPGAAPLVGHGAKHHHSAEQRSVFSAALQDKTPCCCEILRNRFTFFPFEAGYHPSSRGFAVAPGPFAVHCQ